MFLSVIIRVKGKNGLSYVQESKYLGIQVEKAFYQKSLFEDGMHNRARQALHEHRIMQTIEYQAPPFKRLQNQERCITNFSSLVWVICYL